MKKLVFYLFFLITIFSYTQDPYVGYWEMPDKKVVIQIEKINNEYVGYVRWLKDPVYPKGDPMQGVEQFDRKNPDSKLRNRKVMNLQVVGGLYLNKSKTELVDGWIYDSWNGKMYHGTVKVINGNTLNLRGSLDQWGILGYSMKVKRVKMVGGKISY
ncbi:MAG: DUF2147 domain-containing protein [Cetobacterium sp.]|uniref:DUF2147 domain-containing protein n=1 Tax=Cetobacterium sp. TaxID=2071632 RepID=UPI002FC74BA2